MPRSRFVSRERLTFSTESMRREKPALIDAQRVGKSASPAGSVQIAWIAIRQYDPNDDFELMSLAHVADDSASGPPVRSRGDLISPPD